MTTNLDTISFNPPNGYITTDFGLSPANPDNRGNSIVIQTDGKIIMGGHVTDNTTGYTFFALARYNTNGSLDGTFGIGGLVTTQFASGSQDFGQSIALQSDGKIVLGGYSNQGLFDTYFALARYNTDGSLDGTFGSGGLVTTDFTSFGASFRKSYGNALIIQPSDGYIVLSGSTTNGTKINIAMTRYDTTGTLDGTFGTGGKVFTSLGPLINSIAFGIDIDSSSRLVLTGEYSSMGTMNYLTLRYITNGSLDGTFGSGAGYVTLNFTGYTADSTTVKIQTNDFIVVGGTLSDTINSTQYIGLVRYDINGVLDPTFNAGTPVISNLDPLTYNMGCNSIALQSDGKIVVCGFYKDIATGNIESFLLARYLTNGSLDGTFGTAGNGYIIDDVMSSPTVEYGKSVAIQSNGQILVGGYGGDFGDVSSYSYFILARYFGFPPFPPPTPPTPIPIAPICFPAGTPILTDQGYTPIEQIDPEVNTIRNRTIVAITKTITNHDKIVCFERHSLGYNVPNQRTLVSLNHGIIYNKKLIPAKKFVGWKKGVYLKKYNGEYLYNVLMEKHMGMLVNGMKVETLDPRNIIAKLYTNNYSPEQKIKIILKINKYANDNYNKYANFNNYERLQYNRTRRLYEVHRFNPIIGKLHLRTQKNYSFLNNVTNNTIQKQEIYNKTIRHIVPLIKNNSMIKINTNALHRFTRYGRRRR
jgi:uncharacterized delta-60 repeat protein